MQLYHMELVYMDYLTIEANEGGKDVHILVITGHVTWYAQAIITHYKLKDSKMYSPKFMGQINCPLWAPGENLN